MKYRLHIDYANQRATLHLAKCPEFMASDLDDATTPAFWSASKFASEDAAAAAVRTYLITPAGVAYEFCKHFCITDRKMQKAPGRI